jgi:uncharacterized protein (DUF1330 family)
MAKGYVVFIEDINDMAVYEGYIAKAGPTLGAHGGSLMVFQDDAEVIEGTWPGKRTVVLEFESVEKAKAWYNSAEYQAIIGERHRSADANAAILAGFG